uniref:Thioredoxin domain-containing protein n=1 Tax=Leptocylindrus danicus TaxID=163516 RepID=A0A7S2LIQ3_9STRA|mmetsp:Transcript_6199/g.9114  ORF Transcript_6199/g.9114 Transcript_6199/m.9114 type:complete len:309 (+) Transcript_6199:86-1012(+)
MDRLSFVCAMLIVARSNTSSFLLSAAPRSHVQQQHVPYIPKMSTTNNEESLQDISTMRLREIQTELRDMWNVSYADCFDKESLTKRLRDARAGLVQGSAPAPSPTTDDKTDENETAARESDDSSAGTSSTSTSGEKTKKKFNRDDMDAELSNMRVSALREMLGARNIRWANMIEKRDLVVALLDAMEASAGFSISGALTPGEVADLTGEQLASELSGDADTPLLLDVYAVWCGPCQMMAPHLAAAAAELGAKCRVAKIDSDKYGAWASKLRVGGLPTVIAFDGNGNEVNRQEGALMKDGLIQIVSDYL